MTGARLATIPNVHSDRRWKGSQRWHGVRFALFAAFVLSIAIIRNAAAQGTGRAWRPASVADRPLVLAPAYRGPTLRMLPTLGVTARDLRKGNRLAAIRSLLGDDRQDPARSLSSPPATHDLPKWAFSHDEVMTASGWATP